MGILDIPGISRANADAHYLGLNYGLYNANAQNYRKFRYQMGLAQAGAGNCIINLIGDSTTLGLSANGVASGSDGCRVLSYPYRLTDLFNVSPLNASCESIWGTQALVAASFPLYDTRVVYGAGWVNGSATLAGGAFRSPAGVTTAFQFTPTKPFNTIRAVFGKYSTGGSFTVNVDGGATLLTQSTAGAQGTYAVTTTCTLGTHTINLAASTEDFNLMGIETWDSTKGNILVRNMGVSGWKSTDWSSTTNATSPRNSLAVVPADLTVIDLGINDWKSADDISLFTAAMQALITTSKAGGDVLLVGPIPSQISGSNPNITQARMDAYIAAVKQLAVSNNCGVLSHYDRLKSYSDSSYYYTDSLHLNAGGYAVKAQAVHRALTLL